MATYEELVARVKAGDESVLRHPEVGKLKDEQGYTPLAPCSRNMGVLAATPRLQDGKELLGKLLRRFGGRNPQIKTPTSQTMESTRTDDYGYV